MVRKIEIPSGADYSFPSLNEMAARNAEIREQQKREYEKILENRKEREKRVKVMRENPFTVAQAIAQLKTFPPDAVLHSDGCDCTGLAAYFEHDAGDNTVLLVRVDNV